MSRDEEIRQSAGKVAIRDNKGQYAHGFLMQALREAFTEGARWADRTMIKRTSQWLQENHNAALEKLQEALAPTEDGCKISGLTRDCIENIFPELKESKEKQIMEDAVRATIDFPLPRYDFPNIYPNYKELKEYCIRHGIKDNDKVRITIVKDNGL